MRLSGADDSGGIISADNQAVKLIHHEAIICHFDRLCPAETRIRAKAITVAIRDGGTGHWNGKRVSPYLRTATAMAHKSHTNRHFRIGHKKG